MKHVKLTTPEAFNLLRKVYSNKWITASVKARIALNGYKRAFTEMARLTCTHDGDPVEGRAAVVYLYRVGRCDIDAPTKAVQDAFQTILFAKQDDRVVRFDPHILQRPSKAKGIVPCLEAWAWPIHEYEHALDKCRELLQQGGYLV